MFPHELITINLSLNYNMVKDRVGSTPQTNLVMPTTSSVRKRLHVVSARDTALIRQREPREMSNPITTV